MPGSQVMLERPSNSREGVMGNTYSKICIHYVFSTKYRKPIIKPEFERSLWEYMGGIAREHGMAALRIGGTSDHIHALILLPPIIAVSKGVQLIKAGSSKWVNDHYFTDRSFRWQKGYGAFSVSESKIPAVISYIANQKKHHMEKSFQQEYLGFLIKHQIDYDSQYVFV